MHEDDPRLEGLDRADKKLLQIFNARLEPLRAAADAAALQVRRAAGLRRRDEPTEGGTGEGLRPCGGAACGGLAAERPAAPAGRVAR